MFKRTRKQKSAPIVLHKFTNEDYGVTSFVMSDSGKLSVLLREDESGEYIDINIHNFKNSEEAVAKAKSLIQI